MDFAHLTLEKPLKVKSNDTMRKNNPGFLFIVNSKWDLNSGILRVISILKCRNYELCSFDLEKSLKVKSNDTIGKNIPNFLFDVNSDLDSIPCILRVMSDWNIFILGFFFIRVFFKVLFSLNPRF